LAEDHLDDRPSETYALLIEAARRRTEIGPAHPIGRVL